MNELIDYDDSQWYSLLCKFGSNKSPYHVRKYFEEDPARIKTSSRPKRWTSKDPNDNLRITLHPKFTPIVRTRRSQKQKTKRMIYHWKTKSTKKISAEIPKITSGRSCPINQRTVVKGGAAKHFFNLGYT